MPAAFQASAFQNNSFQVNGAALVAGVGIKHTERRIEARVLLIGETAVPLSVPKAFIWGLRVPVLARKRWLREWLHPLGVRKAFQGHLTVAGRWFQYRQTGLPLHAPKTFRGESPLPIRVAKRHTLRDLRVSLPKLRRILRALLADSG